MNIQKKHVSLRRFSDGVLFSLLFFALFSLLQELAALTFPMRKANYYSVFAFFNVNKMATITLKYDGRDAVARKQQSIFFQSALQWLKQKTERD
jgi:hypothetical protein